MYKTTNHRICIANIGEAYCADWVGVLVYLLLIGQVDCVARFYEQLKAGVNINYTLPIWVESDKTRSFVGYETKCRINKISNRHNVEQTKC